MRTFNECCPHSRYIRSRKDSGKSVCYLPSSADSVPRMAVQDVQLLVAQAKFEANSPSFKVIIYQCPREDLLKLRYNRRIFHSTFVSEGSLVPGASGSIPRTIRCDIHPLDKMYSTRLACNMAK